jgi:L-threonylcarbamoyladenylate synthase
MAQWAHDIPASAARLAATCWPGPLTLLVPKADHVLHIVTGGRDTVGIRVPAHPLTTELLERFGGGLAAPSANRFGKVSPTTAEHVRADLGDLVDDVLDGGPCPIGVESTIVDCTVSPPQVLRPGGIPTEDIAALLDGSLADAAGPSRASGMLESHYAPSCPVLLAQSEDELRNLVTEHPGCVTVGVGVDLPTYARGLYEWLRAADREHRSVVVALMPPPEGLGHAIRDRLQKAAALRK